MDLAGKMSRLAVYRRCPAFPVPYFDGNRDFFIIECVQIPQSLI